MENNDLDDLNKLEEQLAGINDVVNKFWAWEKPTRKADPVLENVVEMLRKKYEEKWMTVEYPMAIEESEGLDYLVNFVWAVGKTKEIKNTLLRKSDITGDYMAQLSFDKPENFNFDEFKGKLWESIKNIVFIYNSMITELIIKENEKDVCVGTYFKISRSLRMSNITSYVLKTKKEQYLENKKFFTNFS